MPAHPRHDARFEPFDDDVGFDPGYSNGFSSSDFYPGERIVPLPSRRRGRAIALAAVVGLSAAGTGWYFWGSDQSWQELSTSAVTKISTYAQSFSKPADNPSPAAPSVAPSAGTEPPPREPTPAAPQAANMAALPPPATTGSISPASTGTPLPAADAPAAPAALTRVIVDAPAPPEPAPEPPDPLKRRAASVGLHPELSPVLLARLSAADYRNAEVAIKSALSETPDDGVYVWPRQRKPEHALFEVRFVQGAAPSCRRYVVTITKDRWLTTALPMEKCGPKYASHQRRN